MARPKAVPMPVTVPPFTATNDLEVNPKGVEAIKKLLDTALVLFDAEHSEQNNPDDEIAVRLVVRAREMIDVEIGVKGGA